MKTALFFLIFLGSSGAPAAAAPDCRPAGDTVFTQSQCCDGLDVQRVSTDMFMCVDPQGRRCSQDGEYEDPRAGCCTGLILEAVAGSDHRLCRRKAARAEALLDGTWRLVGRTCAKAGGYEGVADGNRLTFVSGRYAAEARVGACSMRKEGYVEPLPIGRQCLTRVLVQGPEAGCRALYAHVDSLKRRLAAGPVCEEQAFETAELSGKSVLLLREKGGENLFCGSGDTQIDFLEPVRP